MEDRNNGVLKFRTYYTPNEGPLGGRIPNAFQIASEEMKGFVSDLIVNYSFRDIVTFCDQDSELVENKLFYVGGGVVNVISHNHLCLFHETDDGLCNMVRELRLPTEKS
ncbi:MAG: hypothetical protein KJ592_04725 [Nanoarchaeota archaeon]|nr:hypothetical protein [Nanoarchaeota archaeon]